MDSYLLSCTGCNPFSSLINGATKFHGRLHWTASRYHRACLVICQWLRRKPLAELLGKFDVRWLKELGLGGLIGSALMLFPALMMWILGWVDWQWNPAGFSTLASVVLLFAGVAIAEELLFRGFIFQRLIAGLGEWPAQLILAGYFLLTHLNNPGMTGDVKILAGVNIFLASRSAITPPRGFHAAYHSKRPRRFR